MVHGDSVLTHGRHRRTLKLNHYSQRHGCWCTGHELSRCWFGFRWFGSRWDVHIFQHIMPSRHCLHRHMVDKHHCKSAPDASKKGPRSIFQMPLVCNIFFVKKNHVAHVWNQEPIYRISLNCLLALKPQISRVNWKWCDEYSISRRNSEYNTRLSYWNR